MTEKLSKVAECLEQLKNDEIINKDKLSWAIDKLNELPMTVELLDTFRIANILQDIRKKITPEDGIVEKIKFLIKCWRVLLKENLETIIPLNQLKVQSINYLKGISDDSQLVESSSIEKLDKCENNNEIGSLVNGYKDNFKPKVKSTLDLMKNFSHIIEPDLKEKILKNHIKSTKEENNDAILADITSINNGVSEIDFRLREVVNQPVRYADIQRMELQYKACRVPKHYHKQSNCDRLVKSFQKMIGKELIIMADPLVSWGNLRKSLNLRKPSVITPHPRKMKQPQQLQSTTKFSQLFTPLSEAAVYPGAFPEPEAKQPKPIVTPKKPIKIREVTSDYITKLLDRYEARETRKILAKEERLKKKMAENVDENGLFKLKIKINPPKVPPIKIRCKKVKKKRKKKKIIPVPKLKEKKPRKPRQKPKAPITNYLNDIPTLPDLTEEMFAETEITKEIEIGDNENVNSMPADRLYEAEEIIYNEIPGVNCTLNYQTNQISSLRDFYSVLIGPNYLHIFPWVDDYFVRKSDVQHIDNYLHLQLNRLSNTSSST